MWNRQQLGGEGEGPVGASVACHGAPVGGDLGQARRKQEEVLAATGMR